MARKFPYTNLPCADDINAAFHRVESILNGMANQEYIDYVQDAFAGQGIAAADPPFMPDTLPDLWGTVYNLKNYAGNETYYAEVGNIDRFGVIRIDQQYVSPRIITGIAKVWRL